MYILRVEKKPLFLCPPRACLGVKAVISRDAWIQAKRVYLDFLEAFSVDHNAVVGHAMPAILLRSRTCSLLGYSLLL